MLPAAVLLEINSDHPEPRKIQRAVAALNAGELIAYPTDTVYGLGCDLLNKGALDRLYQAKNMPRSQSLALVCVDLSDIARYCVVDNATYRLLRRLLPGPYTFILPATKEVPRRLMHPKKKTVGVRIPDHVVAQAILAELGEPLLSTTLTLPGDEEPMTQGWEIKDRLDHAIDAVIDSGECGTVPTTVVDVSGEEPAIVRVGAGEVGRFE